MKIKYYLLDKDDLDELVDIAADTIIQKDSSDFIEYLKGNEDTSSYERAENLARAILELADYRRLFGPIGIKSVE